MLTLILALCSFLLAGLCLVVAVRVVQRRWKDLLLLDPLTIKEEQHRQKREALILKRFQRLHAEQVSAWKRTARFFQRSVGGAYRAAHHRLQTLEEFYQQMTSPLATMSPSTRERIKTLLTEGRSLARDQKWADAERRFLEILSLDARHEEAYKGLGQIYLKQKMFTQAKETFEFLLKMKKADDAVFAALAEIAEEDQDWARAEDMHLKAVEVSPRQAHRHAELAAYYMEKKELAKAWPSAKRASDLESQSMKYLELCLEVALALQDVAEVRRRLNRLRLLSDDREKYQVWREKVERLEATQEQTDAKVGARAKK